MKKPKLWVGGVRVKIFNYLLFLTIVSKLCVSNDFRSSLFFLFFFLKTAMSDVNLATEQLLELLLTLKVKFWNLLPNFLR